MNHKIIVDSCCDMTEKLKKKLDIVAIPLSIMIGKESFFDDDKLNISDLIIKMKNYAGKISSASPSPYAYKEAFLAAKKSFVITLSSNLSGSFVSAMMGKNLAEKEGAEVHIFDSKSASAGEVLIALKIRKLLASNIDINSIIISIESFIKKMKTYFALEDLDNLIKNGRLHKITGKIITALNIRPIMGSDGNGNIALFSHSRGEKQTIQKLAETIGKSGRETSGQSMVIAHCNNLDLAENLKNVIRKSYQFEEVVIVPTRGISSMYANEKGIIIAF